MSDSIFVSRIIEHGQKKETALLQECVNSTSLNEINDIIDNHVSDPTFLTFWNYLLQTFNNSEELSRKYCLIVLNTLEKLEHSHMSSTHINSIINRLVIDLLKFKTEDLVKLVSYCVQSVQKGNVSNTSWVNLFPQLLNVVNGRDAVHQNDEICSGPEYKTNIINGLCILDWSPNIVTSLAVMFIDMSLSKEEHVKVVNKLLDNIESLTCFELPMFVHNMLKLCKHLHSKYIFFKLQHYFHIRIYALHSNTDSNIDSMDIISVVPEQSAIEAEENVLFHIHQAAINNYSGVKEYLNSLKGLINVPEFILHPFQIVVLLTISKISLYEETAFDIIKASVTKGYKEEEKKVESCWFREILPNNMDITNVFEKVIEFNTEQKQVYLKQGLINLGFVFLATNPAFGNENIAEKHWKLGLFLLLEVIKINRNNTRIVVHKLSNFIITKENIAPYINCLHMLCRKRALVILENYSHILELIGSLIQISSKKGVQVIEAIAPLLKVSAILKDQLILILKKALFSSALETRQVAVTGFLQLLAYIKITDPGSLSLSSSSSQSTHSLLTQLSLSRAGNFAGNSLSGESLALEILNILKRCFMQQAEVTEYLYEGLHKTVIANRSLALPILELLQTHFMTFYQVDSSNVMPLHLSAIFLRKDVDVLFQEPLGKMIHVIGLIVTEFNNGQEENVATKFTSILDDISARIVDCQLTHFELDESTDFSDMSPESREKYLVLRESMFIYSSLIIYKVNGWNAESTDQGNQISALFNAYNRLLQFFKTIKKSKRADKKKDVDKSTSTNDDVSLTGKKSALKIPELEFCPNAIIKILKVLYLPDVEWSTPENCTVLKANKEFHHFILQGTIRYINLANQSYYLYQKGDKKVHLENCEKIASILRNSCLSNFNKIVEFDIQTSTFILEAFSNILQLMFQKNDDVSSFLTNISTEERSNENLHQNLSGLMELFISIYEENDMGDDLDAKKLCNLCITNLKVLMTKIPKNDSTLYTKIIDWLKNYAKRNTVSNKQIVTALSCLLLNANLRFKKTTSLHENIAKNLAKVFETISTENQDCSEEYNLITEASGAIFLQVLCNNLKIILDDFDWLISRIRAECVILAFRTDDSTARKSEELKEKEQDLCCQMCWLINVMTILSDLKITIQLECLIKDLTHIFNTLTLLTKYFTLRSSKENPIFEEARFDRVVKLAGKKLSRTVYAFILFIDENQTSKDEGSQPKRKEVSALKSKVLKETKLIPKLVLEIEQFSKSVIQLSNKTKVDLTKYVGQGTARDFRILNVEEILKNLQADTTEMDISNETTDVGSSSATHLTSEDEDSSNSKRIRLG